MSTVAKSGLSASKLRGRGGEVEVVGADGEVQVVRRWFNLGGEVEVLRGAG